MGTIDTIINTTHDTLLSHKVHMPLSSIPLWKVLWRRYCEWQSLRRSRVALRHLSDQQLCDIGINRSQALEEADKNRKWL